MWILLFEFTFCTSIGCHAFIVVVSLTFSQAKYTVKMIIKFTKVYMYQIKEEDSLDHFLQTN